MISDWWKRLNCVIEGPAPSMAAKVKDWTRVDRTDCRRDDCRRASRREGWLVCCETKIPFYFCLLKRLNTPVGWRLHYADIAIKPGDVGCRWGAVALLLRGSGAHANCQRRADDPGRGENKTEEGCVAHLQDRRATRAVSVYESKKELPLS